MSLTQNTKVADETLGCKQSQITISFKSAKRPCFVNCHTCSLLKPTDQFVFKLLSLKFRKVHLLQRASGAIAAQIKRSEYLSWTCHWLLWERLGKGIIIVI
ncbi:hypothetical protein CEXT_128051 [Caerostris extrusa]|uniref:Uncharacterized protein n=1 Tax=Caerostris extrusa TaxID=172846 RepID=A0AAV4P3L4_CAEEX|nr:hypothetical protein CEXT_128051 [Caerostris extrusa]